MCLVSERAGRREGRKEGGVRRVPPAEKQVERAGTRALIKYTQTRTGWTIAQDVDEALEDGGRHVWRLCVGGHATWCVLGRAAMTPSSFCSLWDGGGEARRCACLPWRGLDLGCVGVSLCVWSEEGLMSVWLGGVLWGRKLIDASRGKCKRQLAGWRALSSIHVGGGR